MSRKKQESLFWGLVLLIVGVLFLVDNLGVDIDIWDIFADFWPLILVAFGIKGIWQHVSSKRKQEEQ